MTKSYQVIGIMSGTSLDGADLVYAEYIKKKTTWDFNIKASETIKYTISWQKKLHGLIQSGAEEFVIADVMLGHYLGHLVNRFCRKYNAKPQFIASHGHTVFHQPRRKTTVQIGNGAAIAAVTGLITVCDFRVTDVAKGGQGAPLVPVGDQLLFADFNYCLNLGGIANISYEKEGQRIAFDICPVNMAMNYLAGQTGKLYDDRGRMAKRGKVNTLLLKQLNNLKFYEKNPPKSLGVEWFNSNFKPLLDQLPISVDDKLATLAEHICNQIEKVLFKNGSNKKNTMLVTGGGAFNTFLINSMKSSLPVSLVIPDKELINFKEALVFGFLGVLRWRNETNTLSTVTGAKSNSSSGCIFNP